MSDVQKTLNRERDVIRRDDQFVDKVVTKVWSEKPSDTNPYIATEVRCHGYELTELVKKRTYVDVIYLLFRGELPGKEESTLFEKLMIAFINPGPRHPATRAAMNAGVGNTDSSHILPIGLTVLGGNYLGASEVEKSMRWLRRNSRRDPKMVAAELIEINLNTENDGHLAPGFGTHFGSVDELVGSLANEFSKIDGIGRVFNWCTLFVNELALHNQGWLSTGLFSAILCDLGFQPRMGPGVYQIISAPGIFAHGIEMANKPMTAMPFLDDKDYFIETTSNEISNRNEKDKKVEAAE